MEFEGHFHLREDALLLLVVSLATNTTELFCVLALLTILATHIGMVKKVIVEVSIVIVCLVGLCSNAIYCDGIR